MMHLAADLASPSFSQVPATTWRRVAEGAVNQQAGW